MGAEGGNRQWRAVNGVGFVIASGGDDDAQALAGAANLASETQQQVGVDEFAARHPRFQPLALDAHGGQRAAYVGVASAGLVEEACEQVAEAARLSGPAVYAGEEQPRPVRDAGPGLGLEGGCGPAIGMRVGWGVGKLMPPNIGGTARLGYSKPGA